MATSRTACVSMSIMVVPNPTLKDYLLAPGSLSVYWLIVGVICFCVWARAEEIWPFGPREIREEFLEAERAGVDPATAILPSDVGV